MAKSKVDPMLRSHMQFSGRQLFEARQLLARKVKAGERLDDGQLSRALDSVIEYAVSAGAIADGLSDAKRNAKIKRVRRALGYTYP